MGASPMRECIIGSMEFGLTVWRSVERPYRRTLWFVYCKLSGRKLQNDTNLGGSIATSPNVRLHYNRRDRRHVLECTGPLRSVILSVVA